MPIKTRTGDEIPDEDVEYCVNCGWPEDRINIDNDGYCVHCNEPRVVPKMSDPTEGKVSEKTIEISDSRAPKDVYVFETMKGEFVTRTAFPTSIRQQGVSVKEPSPFVPKAQRMVHGARLIRTGMGDRQVLVDLLWAITEQNATIEEIETAVREQLDNFEK
jgi:hypothetical protein